MAISINQITDCIFLGSTPYNLSDIDHLINDYGIKSVISLQSDTDLAERNIVIAEFERHYQQMGVDFSRFAIDDFNVEELALKLYQPTEELAKHITNGRKTFVHCNAGICRASSAVLAYLCAYEGYELEHGIELIRQHRPIVNPAKKAVLKTIDCLLDKVNTIGNSHDQLNEQSSNKPCSSPNSFS